MTLAYKLARSPSSSPHRARSYRRRRQAAGSIAAAARQDPRARRRRRRRTPSTPSRRTPFKGKLGPPLSRALHRARARRERGGRRRGERERGGTSAGRDEGEEEADRARGGGLGPAAAAAPLGGSPRAPARPFLVSKNLGYF